MNFRMNKLVLGALLWTFALSSLSSNTFAGGVSGGGGNLAKQQPVGVFEVEDTLKRFKEVFPLVMNQLAMSLVKAGARGNQPTPPANSSYELLTRKFSTIQEIQEVSQKAENSQLTFQPNGCAAKNESGMWVRVQASTMGYYNAKGQVVETQEPMICFDSETIAPLVSQTSVVRELGALFGHEVSHFIGFSEAEAQMFQDYLLLQLARLPYMPSPKNDFKNLAERLERRIRGLEKLQAFATARPDLGALTIAGIAQQTSLMDFLANDITPSHLNGLALLSLPDARLVLGAAAKVSLLLTATPKNLMPGLEVNSSIGTTDLAKAFEGRSELNINTFMENHFGRVARIQKEERWWVPVLFRNDVIVRNVSNQNIETILLEIEDAVGLLKEVKLALDKKLRQLGH